MRRPRPLGRVDVVRPPLADPTPVDLLEPARITAAGRESAAAAGEPAPPEAESDGGPPEIAAPRIDTYL